jgi:hypothetical protein
MSAAGAVSPDPAPVFLHIGPMKTGTTFLQELMVANKDRLAAAGYLFPGDTWARQVRGTRDVLGLDQWDPRFRATTAGAWERLVAEILAHTGTASVVSMEFLSFARRRGAARVVRSLQPAEVHVVLTVRDALDTIPSLWQTAVYNGSAASWPQFMRSVRKAAGVRGRLGRLPRDRSLREFLDAQDVARILRTWGGLVPAQRLHVVTVPPRGSEPGLLWSRFARAVGVDPGVCSEPATRSNASLGYASTDLLRRVNRAVGRLPPSDYNATLKEYLALKVLAGRRHLEGRPGPDPRTREFAARWNERVRSAITASGAGLTGDLDDLPVRPGPVPAQHTASPRVDELLAVAAASGGALADLVRRRSVRLRRSGVRIDVRVPDADGFTAHRWDDAPDPVAAAVDEVAHLARTGVRLYRRLQDEVSR